MERRDKLLRDMRETTRDDVERAFELLATDRRREAVALFEKKALTLLRLAVRFKELQDDIDAGKYPEEAN